MDLVPKPDEYNHTAHATWRVSFDRLKPIARQFFELLAFMHYEQISEDIFRLATIRFTSQMSRLPPIDEELVSAALSFQLDHNDDLSFVNKRRAFGVYAPIKCLIPSPIKIHDGIRA